MAARRTRCWRGATSRHWSIAETRTSAPPRKGGAMNLANRYAVAVFAALCALPAFGQQQKTIEGVVINFGLVTAERAVHAEGHRDMHPDKFPSGSQHVL